MERQRGRDVDNEEVQVLGAGQGPSGRAEKPLRELEGVAGHVKLQGLWPFDRQTGGTGVQ